MSILRESPDFVWRCDGCGTEFTSSYDEETEEETDLPALADDRGRTFCDACYEERFGPGPYEPE